MSYCLNPDCPSPHTPDPANFCQGCGTRLRLANRYRALKQLGEGGFSRTFLAVDEYKPSQPTCVIPNPPASLSNFCPRCKEPGIGKKPPPSLPTKPNS